MRITIPKRLYFIPLVLASGQLAAQTQSSDAERLDRPARTSQIEEVTVTGSRMSLAVKDVPLSISIVSEEKLRDQLARGGTHILEALDAVVPGLGTVSRSRAYGDCITVRGRDPSFQLNGIPLDQNLRRGGCSYIYMVSPFALERVEVVRGATALYGAGAPGGIIDLRTRQATSEQLQADFVVQYGVNPDGASHSGALATYAGVGQKHEVWDYYVGLGYDQSDGGRTPNGDPTFDFEHDDLSFNGSLGLDLGGAGRLRFTGTFYEERGGKQYSTDFDTGSMVAVPEHPAGPDHNQMYTLGVTYELDEAFLGHRMLMSVYHQSQDTKFRWTMPNGGGTYYLLNQLTESRHSGVRSTFARSFALRNSQFDIEYGIDYSKQYYYNPVLADLDSSVVIEHFAPDVSQDTAAALMQLGMQFGRWRLTGGVRYERYSGETGSKDAGKTFEFGVPAVPGKWQNDDLWLLNVGFTFDINPQLQIYGGFNQGADITQLARAARGNQNPETITAEATPSNQYELGLRGTRGAVDLSIAAFYSQSNRSSEVQANPVCADLPICPFIPVRLKKRMHGVEATLDWTVTERVSMGLVYTQQNGEVFEPSLGQFVAFDASLASPRKVMGYVEFEPTSGWHNRLQLSHLSAMNAFTAMESASGFGRLNTEAQFLTHFSSSYAIGPGEVTLSINNLFNEEYLSPILQSYGGYTNVMDEGRRVTLGYRTSF